MKEKINDKLWDLPGSNTTGGNLAMPDEHLWRFAPDVGLPDGEEEVGALRLRPRGRPTKPVCFMRLSGRATATGDETPLPTKRGWPPK